MDDDNRRPVAYDAEGRPLYAAPQPQEQSTQEAVNQPVAQQQTGGSVSVTGSGKQVVHVARSTEPIPVHISEETRRKNEESRRLYPWLNLSEHEYVIRMIPRHSIGIWAPTIVMMFAITIVSVFMFCYPDIARAIGMPRSMHPQIILICLMTITLFGIGLYMAIWVYMQNRFFLTNESVIQEIQLSLFSKREQTVSLMNIEDSSYSQKGILQTFFNYGSIRLSTEGDETTYRFSYVANPKAQVAILNNAVEAFKNGRPVTKDDDD
jgi:hypothetical protein